MGIKIKAAATDKVLIYAGNYHEYQAAVRELGLKRASYLPNVPFSIAENSILIIYGTAYHKNDYHLLLKKFPSIPVFYL